MLDHVRAVQADDERRSPLWRSLYDREPASFHDHVLAAWVRVRAAERLAEGNVWEQPVLHRLIAA